MPLLTMTPGIALGIGPPVDIRKLGFHQLPDVRLVIASMHRGYTWRDNARPSVDVPAPPAPGMHLSETGGRRRGPPAPTTRVLPRRRSGRLWASLPIAECCTTARPTRGAAGRFPGETGPCPPRPGLFRLGPSPTACAGSPHTSGWRN